VRCKGRCSPDHHNYSFFVSFEILLFFKMRAPSTRQSHRRFPLTRLLGDTGNLRVLRALVTYDGPQSSAQLAQESGLTLAGARKVLENLIAQGVVQVLGGGRTRLYQGAISHPLLAELKSVFAHEQTQWQGFLSRLRELFRSDAGVQAAWLYGSVARGEDTPDSDVDIAVLVKTEAAGKRMRQALRDLEPSPHAHLSVITITVDSLPTVKRRAWWSAVLREARTLKGPDPSHC
jgi:predicted nucleotidyltransferase